MKWISYPLILIILLVSQSWAQNQLPNIPSPPAQNGQSPYSIQSISPSQFKNSPQFQQLQIEPQKFDNILKSIEQNNPKQMQQILQDGGWLGSGGGGVKCDSEVMTLEYWENQKDVKLFVQATANETPLQYLERILTTKLEPISPFLVYRLRQAIKIVTQNPWVKVAHMPLLNDIGNIYGGEIPSSCQRLQFVTRVAYRKAGERSKVFILMNDDAMSLLRQQKSHSLAVINEGFLILHEALYTLGVEMDQKDSQNTRSMTAYLMSEDLYGILSGGANPADKLNGLMAGMGRAGFGRLFNLIYSDDRSLATNDNLSDKQLQRIRSYKNLLDASAQIASAAHGKLAAEMSASEIQKLAKKVNSYLLDNATDEECFIAASMEASKWGYIQNLDILMVPGHDLKQDAMACLYVQTMAYSSPIIQKAYRYCQSQMLVH